MVRITISGHPGSGTSTLVKLLSESKGWNSLNGGELFRQEAKRRNMTLADFGELCKNDLDVDRELDALLKQEMLRNDEQAPAIVESRLAGWWAYQLELEIPRIWLDVDEIDERSVFKTVKVERLNPSLRRVKRGQVLMHNVSLNCTIFSQNNLNHTRIESKPPA